MFCPKCGQTNPEGSRFCRGCGTEIADIAGTLAAKAASPALQCDKGKPITYERAIGKLFTGFAFLAVSIALAFSRMGTGWWFWMLIPAFASLGAGVAQYMQLRRYEKGQAAFAAGMPHQIVAPPPSYGLPDRQPAPASVESRYKTGDLVPPSVTDNTTRHLEVDTEGRTMTLPKNG
ncbi:MAG: hypothetical protein UZ17_ACD001001537 [Acidobacteria bacterium OLB17]|nr:MAG: hypothetical protein UZ17_ACD001001537 [Acidobacteria bacterium OLB17]MCZ2391341.1 zinc-ribbon domain-containing protein [Acidobacteriota bacterium]